MLGLKLIHVSKRGHRLYLGHSVIQHFYPRSAYCPIIPFMIMGSTGSVCEISYKQMPRNCGGNLFHSIWLCSYDDNAGLIDPVELTRHHSVFRSVAGVKALRELFSLWINWTSGQVELKQAPCGQFDVLLDTNFHICDRWSQTTRLRLPQSFRVWRQPPWGWVPPFHIHLQ